MIKKILVANRGEIAVRVMRACREMDIPSVAVYSDADKDALFARYADEAAHIGPAPASQSYLNIDRIIKAALDCHCDAIHPGYGFLAENVGFATACEKNDIKFIGPASRTISLMGDKVAAREVMSKAGVPVVPGTSECVTGIDSARKLAQNIGYPIIIKPSGGGGGIGMTIVSDESDLEKALETTTIIARNTFGLSDVYFEKYLPNPRHIEFQVLSDSLGNAIHLGERECSIQRRHQKLIEESPSPIVTSAQREKMGNLVVEAIKSVKYENAATVEFLFAENQFYFLEVNTRVQVEHPVTEMITGVDIVKEQIRIASGLPLSLSQSDVQFTGHAIECRINAEDPLNDFTPAPGQLKRILNPGGTGIRVDSGVYTGFTVPPYYDSMIAKLIAWGSDRNEAIRRMQRALFEFVIDGTKSNLAFHQAMMTNPRFKTGEISTHFLEEAVGLGDVIRQMSEKTSLKEKLPSKSAKAAKIAAIAAASVTMQLIQQQQARQK